MHAFSHTASVWSSRCGSSFKLPFDSSTIYNFPLTEDRRWNSDNYGLIRGITYSRQVFIRPLGQGKAVAVQS
jgi:hypothetical protein